MHLRFKQCDFVDLLPYGVIGDQQWLIEGMVYATLTPIPNPSLKRGTYQYILGYMACNSFWNLLLL